MNNRLLELARQAGLKRDYGSDREYLGDFAWQEFAELVVKECLDIVKSNTFGPAGQYDYSYSEADAAADRRAEMIYRDIEGRLSDRTC